MKGKEDIVEKASLEMKFKSRVGIRCQKNIPPETFLVDPSLALEPQNKQAKKSNARINPTPVWIHRGIYFMGKLTEHQSDSLVQEPEPRELRLAALF